MKTVKNKKEHQMKIKTDYFAGNQNQQCNNKKTTKPQA